MPSPFPGMDPYLESPAFWRDLHHNLISAIAWLLNRDLPQGFAATIDERVYVVPPDRHFFPDVSVARRLQGSPSQPNRLGGTATIAPPAGDEPIVISLRDEPVRESFVEIRTASGARDLIAVIEVLSPANKELASEGREQYRRKQQELLESDTHLLEIDLLRSGEHTVAAPIWAVSAEVVHWNYIVCLHRARRRWEYAFWPITVRQNLPHVTVPLSIDQADVPIDLQAAFERAYETGPYQRFVEYDQEPIPPLSAEDDDWADALLRECGLRQ